MDRLVKADNVLCSMDAGYIANYNTDGSCEIVVPYGKLGNFDELRSKLVQKHGAALAPIICLLSDKVSREGLHDAMVFLMPSDYLMKIAKLQAQ